MFDVETYLRSPISPEEFLTHQSSDYSETIENSTDDQLRSFLLRCGYRPYEIDDHLEAGMSLQELAADLELQGYSLSF